MKSKPGAVHLAMFTLPARAHRAILKQSLLTVFIHYRYNNSRVLIRISTVSGIKKLHEK